MSNNLPPVDDGSEAFVRNMEMIARAFGKNGASKADMKQIFGPFFGVPADADQTDEQIKNTTMKTWNALAGDKTPDPIHVQIAEMVQQGLPVWDIEAWIGENVSDSKAATKYSGMANKLDGENTAYRVAVEERNRTSVYHKLGIPQDIASNPSRDWTPEELRSMFPEQYFKLDEYSKKYPDQIVAEDSAATTEVMAFKNKRREEDLAIQVAKQNLDKAKKALPKDKQFWERDWNLVKAITGALDDLEGSGSGDPKVMAMQKIYDDLRAPRKARESAIDSSIKHLNDKFFSAPLEQRDGILAQINAFKQKKNSQFLGSGLSESTIAKDYMAGAGGDFKTDKRGQILRKQVDDKVRGGLQKAGMTPLLLWLAKSAQVSNQLNQTKTAPPLTGG